MKSLISEGTRKRGFLYGARLDGRNAETAGAVLALALALLLGRNLPAAPPPVEGTKLFAQHCAGCHGADAHGTDHGPPLAGSATARGRSISQLRNLIHDGIPAFGMPAFELPADQLDALAALVHSLNVSAADRTVPGDAVAGEQFFLGQGQCATCHMVDGRGESTGPDLSNVAHEMTVEDLREALLRPSARITPGYELVTVRLRDGKTVRGFSRGRSNFDIQLEDLKGRFHLLQESQISAIHEDKESAMPPVKAGPDTEQDLIAYLSRMTGVKPGAPTASGLPNGGEVDFARIEHPKPGDWLTYNGTLNANRYSDLTQINATNVNQLALKWIYTVPLWKQFLPDTEYYHENMQYFGLEVTPLVADDIMYITGPQSVYALDALTGREIWEYSRPRTPGIVSDASLGTNRGVAILGDKVFRVTDNAHLIALNRTTGKLVWEVVMPDEPQHYGSTSAPLIVKDMVVAGVAGADWGIRGFLAAYKASTGERVWRFWTIPGKGEPGYETWKGKEPTFGGGGTWVTGSYDSETGTLYWPTSTPYPDYDDQDRPGDNLFTECILAMNPDTGKLKWYYQFTPHDVHSYDATEPSVLVDTRYRGQERKLMLHADRNGFFYVLDRTNGQILLAKKFINRLTWASGIGPDGRPQLLPDQDVTCPEAAANWNATAFSPATRLYYVMAVEDCSVKLSPGSWKTLHPPVEPSKKYLRALDIESGRIVWENPQIGEAEGKRLAGVLATAGGILVYGDPIGDTVALDERTGKPLWHFPTNGINKASPMTYAVGGKQFIALAVGPNIMAYALPSEREKK